MKRTATMGNKAILEFCRNNISRAVVIDWRSDDDDWHHFRVERVVGARIAFTGMTDDNMNHHKGDFFWANSKEIKSIRLR